MKILHVSDNHGLLWKLDPTCEVVVHSGDLLPNRTRGIRVIEKPFQTTWVEDNMHRLREWIGDRPFVYCPGDHDFVDPCPQMRRSGINAINLHVDGPFKHKSVRFVGFPWVPRSTSEWNYEADEREMMIHAQRLKRELVDRPEVLVAHSPIRGVLDRNGQGERCGSTVIRQLLQDTTPLPDWYLHGHIHEAAGVCAWSRGLKVSNAATTQRVIII